MKMFIDIWKIKVASEKYAFQRNSNKRNMKANKLDSILQVLKFLFKLVGNLVWPIYQTWCSRSCSTNTFNTNLLSICMNIYVTLSDPGYMNLQQ